MRRCAVVLVVLLLHVDCQPTWTPQVVAGLVSAIHDEFRSRCAFLLLSDNIHSLGLQTKADHLSVWKALSSKNVQASFVLVDRFLARRWYIKCLQKPLFVLLLDRYEFRQFLIEVDGEVSWDFTGLRMSFKKSITPHRDPVWLWLADKQATERYSEHYNIAQKSEKVNKLIFDLDTLRRKVKGHVNLLRQTFKNIKWEDILNKENITKNVAKCKLKASEDRCDGREKNDIDFHIREEPENGTVDHFLNEIFFRVNIPFNCQFLVAHGEGSVSLTEVYNVGTRYLKEVIRKRTQKDANYNSTIFGPKNRTTNSQFFVYFTQERKQTLHLYQYPWGYWEDGHLECTKTPFNERRRSLHGETMRVLTIPNEPFTVLQKDAQGNTQISGFVGRVWRHLENEMNFTTQVEVPTPPTEHRTSTLLIQRQSLFAVFDFVINSPAFRSLHFTTPLFSSSYRVFIRRWTKTTEGWMAFVTPFSPTLWLCCISLAVVDVLLLTLSNHCIRRYGDSTAERSNVYPLYNSMFTVYGIFCSQGQEDTPRTVTCRLLWLLSLFPALVMYTAYSSIITATRAAQDMNLPFQDLHGLLSQPDFRLSVKTGSPDDQMLKATADGSLKLLYNNRERAHNESMLRPANNLDTLEDICSSQHALFMLRDYVLAYVHNITCDIVPLPKFSMAASVALPAHRSNPYLPLINRNLNRMREAGLLQRIFNDERPKFIPMEEEKVMVVTLLSVQPLFLILMLGIISSFLLLGLEIALHRRKSRLAYRTK